jgi:predicted nucleotidyltransferase
MSESLQKALDTIIRVANPDKVILFGSHARGEETPDSDYDFLVLKKGIKRRRKLAQKLYRSFIGVGVPIDVIVNELQEYEDLKKESYMIYKTIDEEGIVLYVKN